MSGTGNQGILIVDDTEANIDILVAMLEDDYELRVAMDGQGALDQVAAEAPDLVLLDIMMPGMSGIEVLEKMKGDPRLRHIPIIMISALDEMKTVVHCIKNGAEDYLPKPFDPVLLQARISASLEKKRLRDAEQHYLRTIMETQEMLNSELTEAADYVRSLLPEALAGSIAARWQFIPSTQLGGDAFGYYDLDDTHFVIFLLDVCGHGVGAALLSISIMNVIRSGSLPGADFQDPAAVLAALNERFQMETQHDKYFTIWYGVYNKETRLLVFGSAGHPPPLLLTGPSEKEFTAHRLKAPGPPIGWDPESEFANASCSLATFARLYLFSDGAYEIMKPCGETMTYEEFTGMIADPEMAGTMTLESIVEKVRAIRGAGTFEDDFSLVEFTFQ